MAWTASFRILFQGTYASQVLALGNGDLSTLTAPKAPATPSVPAPMVLREASPEIACQVLALLQRNGRFVDFVQEDLSQADDAAVGVAARVVHAGCKQVIEQHFRVVPVRSEPEESNITVEAGIAAGEVQLSGNVSGEPPFRGVLKHRGWRVESVELPKLTEDHDAKVLAPAEVEV